MAFLMERCCTPSGGVEEGEEEEEEARGVVASAIAVLRNVMVRRCRLKR